MTTSNTKKLAIFGNPVEHSLSPEIHKQFAEQCGLEVEYIKLKPELDKFKEEVYRFFSKGDGIGDGANVTIPFKQQAYKLAQQDYIMKNHPGIANDSYLNARNDALVSQGGNTLYLDSSQGDDSQGDNSQGDTTRAPHLNIYNTDGIGLVKDMTSNLGWDLKNKKILLVGAGGAIRGIIPALARAITGGNQGDKGDKGDTGDIGDTGDTGDIKRAELIITNRTQERAESLVSYFRQRASEGDLSISAQQINSLDLNDISSSQILTAEKRAEKYHFDIIINGSAFGLGENTAENKYQDENPSFLLTSSLLHKDLLCYDLVYSKDRSTSFTKWARANRTHQAKEAVDGLGMLVEQAAMSFRIWHSSDNVDLSKLDTQKVIKKLSPE